MYVKLYLGAKLSNGWPLQCSEIGKKCNLGKLHTLAQRPKVTVFGNFFERVVLILAPKGTAE